MSNLYAKQLAVIFDKMYQNFIDYREEYVFYSSLCKKYNAKNIVEIGCGSGNLAEKFSREFNSYTGLDLSEDMLKIAKNKFPKGHFIKADMRDFTLPKLADAALITGRSISYLLTNTDLKSNFVCVKNNLEVKGIFIFDFIDADRFISYIKENPIVEHNSEVDHIEYKRISNWHLIENETIHQINWNADYYRLESNKKIHLGTDKSIFRVFTTTEITKQLKLNGFEVLELIDRKSYAFDTFVVIAQKNKKLESSK